MSTTQKPNEQRVLEAAVMQAIRDFEQKSKRLVLGFSLSRVDRSYLQVSALLSPVLSEKRTARVETR